MIITPILVIFLILVFIVVFLFINTIDKRKWLTILVSLVLTPIVYFYVFYPFINIFSNYHHLKYFNSETWTEQPALRYELSDDLIASETLLGKTKSEVKELLGTYEWLGWNDAKKAEDDSIWNYGLGIEPGAFNTEKECLKIRFNNHKVDAVESFKLPIERDAKS